MADIYKFLSNLVDWEYLAVCILLAVICMGIILMAIESGEWNFLKNTKIRKK